VALRRGGGTSRSSDDALFKESLHKNKRTEGQTGRLTGIRNDGFSNTWPTHSDAWSAGDLAS
jgi:hypothetical protein